MTLFVLGIIISIPAAILANILTPRVIAWFAIRNSNYKARKIYRLKREFEYISSRHMALPSEAAAFVAHRVLNSVMDFAFAIIANAFYLTAYARYIKTDPAFSGALAIVSIAAFFLAVYRISRTQRVLRYIYHFDKYKQRTERELQELAGSIDKPNSSES
jgi:hypothetical protein